MTELTSYNERTTLILTVNFFDEDDLPVVPDSATCRIDDVASGTVIRAKTAIGSLSSSVELEVTQDENRNLNSDLCLETRIVTVEFNYNAGRHGTNEYRYQVKNLYGVQSSSPSASISPSASASASA